MTQVLGVDVGGTKIGISRYNCSHWTEEVHDRIDTHADASFEHVFHDIVALIQKHRTQKTTSVGIGVPGLIAQPEGIISTFPNIPGGEGFALQTRLNKSIGLPVFVDNDANCFALAEAKQGAGKGHKVVVGITLGTGVGGGIILDGNIFHGAHGFSAEIGHMLLQPGIPPYESTDKRGEVEQFFSGTAMGKRCEAASDPEQYLEGAVCSFMHKDIFKEVSWLLVNIIHLLDPSVIIFGGSAGHSLAKHFDKVKKELKNWLLPGTPIPELRLETLRDASTLGAALLTQQ